MALYLRSVRKKSLHVIVRLALDRPDVFGLLLERVDVHHPAKYLGINFPPAASHSVRVVMEPAKPNFAFGPQASFFLSGGGRHMLMCACHCAMLKGILWSRSFQLEFFGAVYMTPISL